MDIIVNIQEIKIDEELRDLLPPLTQEEFEQLEYSILTYGLLDAIKVWENPDTQEQILIDGHNRFNICMKNNIPIPEDKIQILYKEEFENRNEVINWIIDFQLARRNLTDGKVSYFRGLQYSRGKVKQGTNNQHIQSEKGQSDPFQTTAEKLAKQYNVSEKTIKRNAQFATAVDAIAQSIGVEAKNKILNEEIEISKGDVILLSKMDIETQRKYLIDNEDKKVKIPKKEKVKKDEPEVNVDLDNPVNPIDVDAPSEEVELEVIVSNNNDISINNPIEPVEEEVKVNISDAEVIVSTSELSTIDTIQDNLNTLFNCISIIEPLLNNDLYSTKEQQEHISNQLEELRFRVMTAKNTSLKCKLIGYIPTGAGRPFGTTKKPKVDESISNVNDTNTQEDKIIWKN